MNAGPSETPNVYELADEYLERCRTGKRPQLSEYTDKYPALTAEIREIFPMMLLMEDNAPVSESGTEHELNLEQLGDFRIIREIGRGGMGVVYEAVQESLNRQVALKVCPMSSRLSSRNRERFRRESRAAAMLHHTNIVPVFAVGEDEGNLFYAMQYIRGATLDDVITELRLIWQHSPTVNTNLSNVRLRRSATGDQQASEVAQSLAGFAPVSGRALAHPLTGTGAPAVHESAEIALPGASTADSQTNTFRYWDSVARAGVQVADALDYAHGMGTLHRDIKPSNLMLDATGAVWVMDFGLAKSMEEDNLTQTGELIGTMRYMSPEQCVGEPDQRSDIYSLGLTLYEMLALRPAFEELNRSKLLRAIAETDPVAPRKLNPQIPRDLETIVLKSIDREPARRYQTARELHDDLARFLQREPIHARPISATERIGKWVRRRPMVATLTAALAATFCISFALITWNWLDARAARDEAIASADKATRLAASEKVARDNAIASAKEATRLAASEKAARYRGAINRVHLLSSTDIGKAESILASFENTSKDLWEWGYLNQMVHQAKYTLQAGSDTAPWVRTLAFSDDERFLAVGAGRTLFPGGWQGGGRVTVWDLESGDLARELPITNSVGVEDSKSPVGVGPYSVALSPDGSRIAVSECTGGSDKESYWSQHRLGIWEVHSPRDTPLFELAAPLPPSPLNRVSDLRFTADGSYIVGTVWVFNATSPFGTAVWNATGKERGKLTALLEGDELLLLDGGHVVVARRKGPKAQIVRGKLALDSSNKLEEEQVLFSPATDRTRYQDHGAFNVGLAGADENSIANWRGTRVWLDQHYRLMLRDLGSGVNYPLWGHDRHKVRSRYYLRPVSDFHPNAAMLGVGLTAPLLATGSDDGTVRIWNTNMHVFERRLAGHSINVQSVAFSHSGNLLASGDWSGEVRVWSPAKRAHILDTSLSGPAATSSTVEAIAFAEDGSHIVACKSGANFGSHQLVTVDYRAGEETRAVMPRARFFTRARDAAFGNRGAVLVTLAQKEHSLIYVVDTKSGESKQCQLDADMPVREIAVSGNGKRFAAAATISQRDLSRIANPTCWISVHNTEGFEPGKPLWTDPRPGYCVTAIGLNDDGTHLVVASLSGARAVELEVINIETRKRIQLPGLEQFVSAVEFSPDGSRLAAATEQGPGAIFDCETGELLARLSSPGGVEDLAWNPDGTRLAGANRDVVTLWDSEGHDLITLKSDPRTGDVQWDPRVTFSPDGKLIAATQWNDKIRVWTSQ